MTWPQIAEQIAAHRSELERIETELRVLLDELPADDDPRTRVVRYHLEYVLTDHLQMALMGTGAARRMAESPAAASRVAASSVETTTNKETA